MTFPLLPASCSLRFTMAFPPPGRSVGAPDTARPAMANAAAAASAASAPRHSGTRLAPGTGEGVKSSTGASDEEGVPGVTGMGCGPWASRADDGYVAADARGVDRYAAAGWDGTAGVLNLALAPDGVAVGAARDVVAGAATAGVAGVTGTGPFEPAARHGLAGRAVSILTGDEKLAGDAADNLPEDEPSRS